MKGNTGFLAIVIFLLAAAGGAHYLTRAGDRQRVPGRIPLEKFPLQLAGWRQIDASTLGEGQTRELGADDYLSRTYADDHGNIAYLFIAYYFSQRHRQTIHSPQNCIPGAGWTMDKHRLHALDQASDRKINEYLIKKDGAAMLAFYWYHGRGRMTAGEYRARFETILDALGRSRTDGALIRIIVPSSPDPVAEDRARQAGLDFSRQCLEVLRQYVPD